MGVNISFDRAPRQPCVDNNDVRRNYVARLEARQRPDDDELVPSSSFPIICSPRGVVSGT